MEPLPPDDLYKERYLVQEKIGQGGFGKVFLVKDKEGEKFYAAKCIKARGRKEKERGRREVAMLKSLDSNFVIRLVDAFEGRSEVILVTEYLAGGELFERVVDEDFDLTESHCVLFVRQICQGVEYLHDRHIVHMDIKPENIMCTEREGTTIKIVDFGTALLLSPVHRVQNLAGTPEFMAPEVVNYEDISTGSDMWSVGVLSYVLLSGYSPFLASGDGDTINRTLANVTLAKYDFDFEEFDSITAEAKDFITRLLRRVPGKRMTAGIALQHDWLKERTRRRKTCRIKIENLRKFLNRRKMQRVGKALVAISAFKEAARTSIGSRSSGYQTLDLKDHPTEENGEEEEEKEEDQKEGKEEEDGLISVSQSQLIDNSNSSDCEDKEQDDSEDSGEDESGEIDDSVVKENGMGVNRETKDNGSAVNGDQGPRENGEDGRKKDHQATLSVTSVRKYQRAATRPPPGTVKSLMAKFQ